jgi:hypothetical protein
MFIFMARSLEAAHELVEIKNLAIAFRRQIKQEAMKTIRFSLFRSAREDTRASTGLLIVIDHS